MKMLFDARENNQNDVVLCAGLPYERAISLTVKEKEELLVRTRRERRVFILWLLGVPACLAPPVILWVFLDTAAVNVDIANDIVAVVAIVLILVGIPAALYYADRALKRFRVLDRTLSADHIRRFTGSINHEDWTNQTYDVLKRAGYLDERMDSHTHIDLHAADNVLFRINDNEIEKWISLDLTRAARPPDSPARFKAPIEWVDPEREDEILRRRMTANEGDEILGYARKIRRRRWWLMLLVAWPAAVLTRLVGTKIVELEFPAMFGIWAVVTIPICAIQFYRLTSSAELYDQDREEGWLIVLEPAQLSTISDGERQLTQEIETLPYSGAVWTIGGNPAGWRKVG